MEHYAQTPSELKTALLFKLKKDHSLRRAELEPFLDTLAKAFCGIGNTAEHAMDNACEALDDLAIALLAAKGKDGFTQVEARSWAKARRDVYNRNLN